MTLKVFEMSSPCPQDVPEERVGKYEGTFAGILYSRLGVAPFMIIWGQNKNVGRRSAKKAMCD